MASGRLFIFLLLGLAVFEAGLPGQSTLLSERAPRYLIEPNDVLEIRYRYTPEFDQTATVNPDGFISLNEMGDVKVQGLPLDQARTLILEKARLRLRDPELSVYLKEFEKPFFFVGGEVTNPGRYELHGMVSPIQAVAMAGGFKTSSAKASQVILFRRVGPDLAKTQVINLKEQMNGSAKEIFGDLHPGDTLIVPQNRVSKVERFVKWGNFGIYANPWNP